MLSLYLVRECICGAEERFEGIEAGYREAAPEVAEDLGAEGPDFEGPLEELDALLEQLRSNARDLELARSEMERKAGRIEEEHRERVEALAVEPG